MENTIAPICIDFTKENGPVKPVHGTGQPPILGFCGYSMFHYLKEAGVPFSRLHDTGGAYGNNIYVDIPNLFRNFDANPYDPASYDFTFTDKLLAALIENGVEPYFRLGVTIENAAAVKAYRIFPPKDNLQWARICEGIIRHYTEGWADGFQWKISHWEIWNEPENMPDPLENQMWRGTFQQYLALYDTASKYLKSLFPHLKIGGYASCGLYAITHDLSKCSEHTRVRFLYLHKCFLEFVEFAKQHQCPLDFFSFHGYADVDACVKHAAYIRKTLDEAGFQNTEMSLNEWLPSTASDDCGSMKQAAYIAAMLLGMQNSPVDDAELYDARCGMGAYSPLFHPVTRTPRLPYYTLLAFNELYKRGTAVPVTGLPEGLWACAAKNTQDGAIMLANISGKPQPLNLNLDGKTVVSCRLLDTAHTYEEVPLPENLPNEAMILIIAK